MYVESGVRFMRFWGVIVVMTAALLFAGCDDSSPEPPAGDGDVDISDHDADNITDGDAEEAGEVDEAPDTEPETEIDGDEADLIDDDMTVDGDDSPDGDVIEETEETDTTEDDDNLIETPDDVDDSDAIDDYEDEETDIDTDTDTDTTAWFTVVDHSTDVEGNARATLRLMPGEARLDPDSLAVTMDRQEIAPVIEGNDITVEMSGLAPGLHNLRVTGGTSGGAAAIPLLLKLVTPDTGDWGDGLFYNLITDRFHNGNPANDLPVTGADYVVNYQGGDWAGILSKLESGYFDALGVSALVLSSPVDNLDTAEALARPNEHRCGLDPNTCSQAPVSYAAYPGDWPVNLDAAESRFGQLEELQALVEAAHQRGIRVVFDFPLNHVHTSSPFYQTHQHEYFNWPDTAAAHICQDVGWMTEPTTCWFRSFLADIDYRKPAAVEAMLRHVVGWVMSTGADGLYLKDVKYVERDFLAQLRSRLEMVVPTTEAPFLLLGSEFSGDAAAIAGYLGNDEMHAMENFPVNLEVLRGFASHDIGLDAMDGSVRGIQAVYPAGAMLTNFLDGPAITRFVSLAAGDIHCGVWDVPSNSAQGWLYPPAQPETDTGYARLRLAATYIMTIPGVPFLYYGDEIGLAGAGAPDNQRIVRFDGDLGTLQSNTLAFMQTVAALRATIPALQHGDWPAALHGENDVLVYGRTTAEQTVVVALNLGTSERNLLVPVSSISIADGTTFQNALIPSPPTVTVAEGKLPVAIGGESAAILISR